MVKVGRVHVKVLRLAFALAVVAVTVSAVDAATASWDPNPEPNIAGYKVSYGTEPGVHGTTIDVGNLTTFQFNPPPGRRYYVVVQAYFSTGELSAKSAEATIDIPALVVAVNRAPTLTQPADQSSKQDANVSLALVASDPDGTALTYSSTGLPPGLSLGASSGIIAGVVSKAGSFAVTVTVSDGALSASRSFTWTVTPPVQDNRAPTLTQPADQNTKQDTTVSLTLVASDPDGTALSFSATGLPPGLSLGATSGTIAGAVSKAGSYPVTVTVSDGALSASRSFTWTVTAPVQENRAPTLAQPAAQTSKRNANVTLPLAASDPDGTALTYSATGLPPGLALGRTSGIIAGVPSQTGSYQVSVTASDGALSVTQSFTWMVTEAVNAPAVIDLTPLDTTLMLDSTNYSAAEWLKVETFPADRVSAAILMKFNLSQIPANATIQSAVLTLTLTEVDAKGSDPNYRMSLHQIINRDPDIATASGMKANAATEWTANKCCQKDVPMAQGDISSAHATTVIDRTLSTKTWDAVTPLRAWLTSPSTNYGLLLNADTRNGVDRGRTFASAQDAVATRRPFLRVTYTLPASSSTNVGSTAILSDEAGVPVTIVKGPADATVDANNDQPAVLLQSAGRLSGVTALQDGRLVLIENERSLSVVAPGSSVSQTILADSDASHAFTEVAVNTRFPATRHVFVGVVRRLDETTYDFAVLRYREVNGSLGEGAAIVSGLRFYGAGTPRFVVDDDARVYVAMPETDRSDIYSAGILRFDADGSVPKENRAASPLWALGFSRPANLGWHGPSLVATGADRRWSYPAAQINPGSPSKDWPQTLEPMSLGSSGSVVAAAFATGSTESAGGLRAFVDSSGRLFRLSVDSRKFENVPIPEGLTPISAAAGFEGQIYLIARAGTGEFVLLEFPTDIN